MPAFDLERFEKLLACKRAAMEYLSRCPPEELDEAERLLCVEVANCAEALRRRGCGGDTTARDAYPRPGASAHAVSNAPRPGAPLHAGDGAPCPAARSHAADNAPCPEAAAPRPADGDPLDVDYLDCPPRDGGAVYCP